MSFLQVRKIDQVEKRFDSRLSEEIGRVADRVTTLDNRLTNEISKVNKRLTSEIGKINERISKGGKLYIAITQGQKSMVRRMFVFPDSQVIALFGFSLFFK